MGESLLREGTAQLLPTRDLRFRQAFPRPQEDLATPTLQASAHLPATGRVPETKSTRRRCSPSADRPSPDPQHAPQNNLFREHPTSQCQQSESGQLGDSNLELNPDVQPWVSGCVSCHLLSPEVQVAGSWTGSRGSWA